jgi:hypothetical protein
MYLNNPITRKEAVSVLVVEIMAIFCSSSAKSDLFPDVEDRGDDEPRFEPSEADDGISEVYKADPGGICLIT